jgi:hypothetical protein
MGGSPGGILVGNTSLYSCKRLVIEDDKVLEISSMENKASLHIKAYHTSLISARSDLLASIIGFFNLITD